MSTVTPTPDGMFVEVAVSALHCFADNLNREHAAVLIDRWRHRQLLSAADLVAVLRHFPTADMLAEHEPRGSLWESLADRVASTKEP